MAEIPRDPGTQETGPDQGGSPGQLASLWRALRHLEGRRLWIGLGLLVLGTLSEGAAIIIFLPMLQMVGTQGTIYTLVNVHMVGPRLKVQPLKIRLSRNRVSYIIR